MKKENDIGHAQLLLHIRALLKDAEEFQFHDFKNSYYATPKLSLVTRLEVLIKNVKQGTYDNETIS